MNKYLICCYAICKNEEKFAERWFRSVSEADLVIVGDTGSEDNTVNVLRNLGAEVYELNLDKFRFDEARNKCLEMIPQNIDICVSSDLDEIISEGWRDRLDSQWEDDTTRASCKYIWSYNEDGSEGLVYNYQRIHQRDSYRWIYPTHEVLQYIGNKIEKEIFIDDMVYHHYPDKDKSRGFNLELLELAIKEYPQDSRNYYYLGREYLFAQKYEKCIHTLIHYLYLPHSQWSQERASAMRYIARAYKALGNLNNSKKYLLFAIAEQPDIREGYVEMAILLNELNDFLGVYYNIKESLKICNKNLSFINEDFCWNHIPYDLLAVSCYHLGFKKEALDNINIAIEMLPNCNRLHTNKAMILAMPD